MIIGYHAIFSVYGFWLPNDPRGSWSDFVGSWDLFRYGPATKTTETRSVAHLVHDNAARLEAKKALKYAPVEFTGLQARAVGRGFEKYVKSSGLTVRACAILHDHVHIVVDRFRLEIEPIVIQLKGEATQQLVEEKLHPFGHLRDKKGRVPKCWARGQWSVFLNSEEDVQHAIEYVRLNPIKEGKPFQRWAFVV